MILANLTRRILIEVEVTSKNAIGAPVETYAEMKYTYASVTHRGGGTEFNEEGAGSYSDTDFTIRYDSRINYKCRVKYNGTYYKILHIEPVGRKEGFRLRTIMFDNE